ncbi:MAG: ankyrin repeat domain-containing protein [Treponema sp.]|nr:ankyrin repeat domain-containing protein [Treponema sp.]
MKKASFFPSPVGILTVFLLLTFSCASAPEAAYEAPAEEDTPINPSSPVWAMLQKGDDQARRFFLGEVEVNATDHNGKTPLHYAAERRDAPLASFFLALGANPNTLDNEGQSALGICISNDDPVTAKVITAGGASGGANIHLPIANNTTAASFALDKGAYIFKALLTPSSIALTDSEGRTALHLASIKGNLEAAKDVLSVLPSSSVSINLKDNSGNNALDYALSNPGSKSHIEIAEQLILSGSNSEYHIFSYFGPAVRTANYNTRRNEGLAPIHYAVMGNYTGLIEFLLERNIDVNIKSTSGATALHEAVRKGNINIIKMLLENDADVNARDAKGNTPLHTGIPASVHKEVVILFLEKGADPNLRDEHGDTPLHIAIILNRSVDVIQAFLNGGSDVHIRNIEGKIPLYIAVQENRAELIPVLLSYGSEVFAADNSGVTPFDIATRSSDEIFNLMITVETVNQRDSYGNTMLHATVRNRGTPSQIGRILDQRAPVDSRNRDGDTALHIAVRMNQRQNGEFLISRGASIFSLNAAGHSPLFLALSPANGAMRDWIINSDTIIAKDGLGNNMLHYAASWNLINAIPVIVRNGISVEDVNATGQTPLFMAVITDSPPTIRALVDNNANINVRDTQGSSLLHSAVRWNAINSSLLLLSLGIDINVFSLNGNTPLHDAVILGMSDIESLLISAGADLEVRNIDGNTPFMEAVRSGLIASVLKLNTYGADSSTRNTRGDTPLHIAVSMERFDIINVLLGMNASIHARNTRERTPFQTALSQSSRMVSVLLSGNRTNISDDMGNTALHIAIQERAHPEIIKTIITGAGRINAVDSNGRTPLRLAVDLNAWELAKLIADEGADPFIAAIDNKTPAEIAFSKGEECIRAIFSGRAINARDSSGNTILHIAARHSNPLIISLLIELGANRTIRNIASEIPFDIAVRWNRNDNAELLRS